MSERPAWLAPRASTDSAEYVKPFVHDGKGTKALHFSIGEMQSRMLTQDPDTLDLEYTRVMMGFVLFNPQPRNIAMIGLGGGSLAKFCHRHLKASRIQVVEINPHVIALRDEFHVPADDERLTVVQGDGAQFVRRCATECDVLIVDGFDSGGQPARLSSQRFYDDCFERLQPDGIMVVNLHFGHARFDIFLDRIRRSFSESVFVVHTVDRSNSVVFACKGHAFERFRPGAPLGPKTLESAAADQLMASFALVTSALKDQNAARRAIPRP